MFDRLPTPFGLVRAGVAPDHQKIKSVTKIFDRTAARPGFRFFGYVEIGKDLYIEDLREHYHQIVFTTGAQTDKNLNIPGIDLHGSYAATNFVAWYNGHPDYQDLNFDLSVERVAVIGVGNVAVDVARILCRTPEELRKTDIANHALDALTNSKVKEVYVLGRRGPAQAKFTPLELKELGELEDADIVVLPEEAELDDLSQIAISKADRGTVRNTQLISDFSTRPSGNKSRSLHLRFLVSPVELYGDEGGNVTGMRLVHNELYATDAGTLRPRATDRFEELKVDLVFRSIGYRGVPITGVPFNDNWGVMLNKEGRIIDPETESPCLGEYTAGWIKRGPSGVIGTNKPDAVETVRHMLTDFQEGQILQPSAADGSAIEQLVRERQPEFFNYEDWTRLNEVEINMGVAEGRPRVKITTIDEMLEVKRMAEVH
jgi:ferredoxin--NADP+ reductase